MQGGGGGRGNGIGDGHVCTNSKLIRGCGREVGQGAGEHHLAARLVAGLDDREAIFLGNEDLTDDLDRPVEVPTFPVEQPSVVLSHGVQGSRPAGAWDRAAGGPRPPRLGSTG